MTAQRRIVLILTSLTAVLALAALFPSAALADNGPMGANTGGWDISWPQCGKPLPDIRHDMFHVVGVTGGRPFTGNDCLRDQFNWAEAGGHVSFYVNLEFGLDADNGPLACRPTDQGCQAYNWGYRSAVSAHDYAQAQTDRRAAATGTWWLDVETENIWSTHTDLNGYVVQGALDYLQRMEGHTVGIYSTSFQWRVIAGDFAPPGTPNWVAGASGISDVGQCQNPLWPGGTVWAFQYLNPDLDLDQDRGC